MWLQQHISTTSIWVIGASHGLYGINPCYFSKPAFNSSHVSQTLPYDAFIFNKFINKADSLEWLILPISYFSFVYSLEESDEWWRIKNYCIYYECPYHKWKLKYHLEILGNPLTYYKQINRVGEYWLRNADDRDCDSLGFSHGYSKENRLSEQWWNNGLERARHHTKNLEERNRILEQNINSLDEIISQCYERNVNVLLLTTPVCETYFENVDSLQYIHMVNICKELENKYQNTRYLNLFHDSRFELKDFYDADHLEAEGAKKLTGIISDYLQQKIDK